MNCSGAVEDMSPVSPGKESMHCKAVRGDPGWGQLVCTIHASMNSLRVTEAQQQQRELNRSVPPRCPWLLALDKQVPYNPRS